MARKISKESVDYRRATTNERCGNCIMFRTPNLCTLVQGFIRKSYTCNRWYRKRT